MIVAPRTRGARRIADDLALARRLRRERFDLALDLHGGPRSAWLTWASGATRADRLRHPGARAGCTRGSCTARARPAAAAFGRQPVGSARRRSRAGPADAPDRDARPRSRWRSTAPPTRGWRRGWRRPASTPDDELVVLHVSAGNPFRRWPEPFFAETAAALAAAQRAAAARLQLRAVGPRGGGTDRGGRARRGSAARRRPHHRSRRIRSAGAQSADRPEPAVRRRRHGTAAHRRGHGHAGRRHLRPDAVGALGAVARRRRCATFSIERERSALPAVRPAGLRAGRLPLPDAADAGRAVIAAAERARCPLKPSDAQSRTEGRAARGTTAGSTRCRRCRRRRSNARPASRCSPSPRRCSCRSPRPTSC